MKKKSTKKRLSKKDKEAIINDKELMKEISDTVSRYSVEIIELTKDYITTTKNKKK
jgi:hypothetical protein